MYSIESTEGNGFEVRNQEMRVLVESIHSKLQDQRMDAIEIIGSMVGNWYFMIFVVSVIAHFVSMNVVIYKIWKLRALFRMCLDVMIVADTAPLEVKLVEQMSRVRVGIECRRVCERELKKLLGRYYLDKVILEFTGDFVNNELQGVEKRDDECIMKSICG